MQLKFIILQSTAYTAITEPRNAAAIRNAVSNQYNAETDIPIIYIEPTSQILVRDVFYGVNPSTITTLANAISALQTAIGDEVLSDGSIKANINTLKTAIGSSADTASASGSIYARIAQLVSDLSDVQSGASDDAADAMAEALLHTTVSEGNGINVTTTAKTEAAGADYEISVDTDVIATKTYAEDQASAAQSAAESTAATDATSKVNAAKTELKGNSSTDTKDSITIEGAKKYAKDLVDTLSSTLSGADSDILETLNKVKAELQNPDSAAGLTSFLDKVTTLINGFDVAGTGSDNNLKNIKTYIDSIKTALESSIGTLSGDAVKQVNGETPDANGAVTIDGADINVTGYSKSGQTGNVAASDTVNNAIAKVENKADGAQSTANTAVSDAAAAQGTANTAVTNAATAEGHAQQALTQLTWIIV